MHRKITPCLYKLYNLPEGYMLSRRSRRAIKRLAEAFEADLMASPKRLLVPTLQKRCKCGNVFFTHTGKRKYCDNCKNH